MSSISNTMRDTAKNAMDAGQEAGQAASAGARNIQADLVSLRDDVARLTHQIADIFAAKGTASWQRAKSDLDGAISDAGEKGREASRPRLPVRSDLETLSSVPVTVSEIPIFSWCAILHRRPE